MTARPLCDSDHAILAELQADFRDIAESDPDLWQHEHDDNDGDGVGEAEGWGAWDSAPVLPAPALGTDDPPF